MECEAADIRPCDALEANVRAALTPRGFTVLRFELKAE